MALNLPASCASWVAMATVRPLSDLDRSQVVAFLEAHHDHTLFLQGNLAASGFEDTGDRYGGAWVGAFDDARLVGVAALFWNGNVILYAPGHESACAAGAWRLSKRRLAGVIGPCAQVAAALSGLGLEAQPVRLSGPEVLYGLALEALRVPELLAGGAFVARRATPDDREALAPLIAGYEHETLGLDPARPGASEAYLERAERVARAGTRWVLVDDGRICATSAFNTRTRRCVQIGGVFTPPALRSRGYAGAILAASLLAVRDEGVDRSVLFTPESNGPARRCYENLGYQAVGDYSVTLFERAAPWRCS